MNSSRTMSFVFLSILEYQSSLQLVKKLSAIITNCILACYGSIVQRSKEIKNKMDQHESNRICGDATGNQRTEQIRFCKTLFYSYLSQSTPDTVNCLSYLVPTRTLFFSVPVTVAGTSLFERGSIQHHYRNKKRCADQYHH